MENKYFLCSCQENCEKYKSYLKNYQVEGRRIEEIIKYNGEFFICQSTTSEICSTIALLNMAKDKHTDTKLEKLFCRLQNF